MKLDGLPVSASNVRSMLIRMSRKLGLPQLHPHALRHAHAVDLHCAGESFATIQKTLGHKNLNNTVVYLASLGEEPQLDLAIGEW